MHSLDRCILCGKVFNGGSLPGNKKVCPECLAKLEAMYSKLHDYIRKCKDDVFFDPAYLAKATGISLENVKLLISMGYLERDIQTWSSTPSERSVQAKKFEREIDRIVRERRNATYGGKIYNRKPSDGGT